MSNSIYGGAIKKIISPKLLFTNTYSLFYEINIQDLYKDLLDFSDYPLDSKFLILPIAKLFLK